MSPTTKESQRAELHKTIWRIANDLRGSVDGWDFKTYVLGMLFYRFISENLTAYINKAEIEAGETDFDYARLPDAQAEFGRKDTVEEKGFYILPSDLFQNVRRNAANDPNLNETLERVFKDIEGSALGTDSEGDLKGLFDDLDVNSSKLGNTVAKRNEKLVKLLDAIGDLPLGNFDDHTIDLFGDAYEYLMQMYASQAGKSGGEYYTPQEVSELLARIAVAGKQRVNKVYDPAAGSGSLLLKFAKVLGKENVGGFFGQEINLTTYNLARINMFLHDVNYEKFNIAHGDTLLDPQHWDDEPFEAIVSNPPYSIKWDGDANPLLINDERFAPAGVLAPKRYADLAFTMHMLSWLAVDGTAAIVEFPGVLYRGGAEAKIRKYLIDNNYVDAVIQLPPDLFFGTSTATCIIVLKKSKSDSSVLFVNASKLASRVGNKNKLLEQHLGAILDALTARESVDYFTRLVPNEDIAEDKFNLTVSSWVATENIRESIDIGSLNAHIAKVVLRQTQAREEVDTAVAELMETAASQSVEFVRVGDIAQVGTGSSDRKDAVDDGEYPFYVRSQTVMRIDTYEFDEDAVIIPGEGGVGDIFHFASGKYALHQRAYRIHFTDDRVLPKFAFYYLTSNFKSFIQQKAVSATVTSIRKPMLTDFRMPLPPMDVQLEIVRVLDRFTALDRSLEDELASRRSQYGFYRDGLLTFEERSK